VKALVQIQAEISKATTLPSGEVATVAAVVAAALAMQATRGSNTGQQQLLTDGADGERGRYTGTKACG